MAFSCLFHVHTNRSFDSLLSARAVVSAARRLNAQALIVSDHNTIQGAMDAAAIAAGNPPVVIIAAEYSSEKGDIIGLFLKEEIRSKRSNEILEQIRAQDGLVVLPHPYKAHRLDDDLLSRVDLIETYNGRCSDEQNAQAEKLAQQRGLPSLAGADAHCSLELGSAMNEFLASPPQNDQDFRKTLLEADRRTSVLRAPAICRPYSQLVRAVKTRDARLFAYQAKHLVLALAHGSKH